MNIPLYVFQPSSYWSNGQNILNQYMVNAVAYINKTKVERIYCGHSTVEYPNEAFMRGLEEYLDIPEYYADEFRRNVAIKYLTHHLTDEAINWQKFEPLCEAISKALEHVNYSLFPFTANKL